MRERIGAKINREKGWVYFLDSDGYVCKIKENEDSRLQGLLITKDAHNMLTINEKRLLFELNEKEMKRAQREKIRVGKERIRRERGYLYFIDNEGYPARTKIAPRNKGGLLGKL